MAKYQASPHYDVEYGNKSVKFDWLGNYETSDADEIKALDALVPTWIKRIDEPEETEKQPVETEETPESEPEKQTEAAATETVETEETPKPAAKSRKSSGK